MSLPAHRSFCVTIRPRHGISDSTVSATLKWLRKQDYAVAVLEKENEARHLHAQMWFTKPRARGDINKQIQRICEQTIEDWTPEELKVLRGGTLIAYSDWANDYLIENDLKTNDPNILINSPPNKTIDYYPTEEEQDRVQKLKTAVDPRFFNLEQDYLQWNGDNPVTHKSVASFLADSMFVSRTLKVIIQKRDRLSLCTSLYCYITKSTDPFQFMEKSENDKKYEKLLSHVNTQWHEEEYSPDPSFLARPQ